jgi:2-C-methyl-D-erythritol 4-phosphate cytidylyltransferase
VARSRSPTCRTWWPTTTATCPETLRQVQEGAWSAFRAADLLMAHRGAEADGFEATDTAGILTAYTALAVAAVDSDEGNLKLTVAEDFRLAEALSAG